MLTLRHTFRNHTTPHHTTTISLASHLHKTILPNARSSSLDPRSLETFVTLRFVFIGPCSQNKCRKDLKRDMKHDTFGPQ
ncbi:hypothetical protein HBH56_113080 [Parastagonospora nodorum]|uniref:Uncharacterized protein n=1 Tax=Phaeosphaeria nodorum (strain SN15 / ATCC MYA-4574 / FGSC 10173) TaxID=321614 RepID=A0A7U2FI51_PHANO|nr:hypothetical protein HBH56_113080 [Parastagonospora nodorum]QRD03550.1 hypothetical protein JI435_419780 [Parastagonospora nodorum SN15]KAH3921514.1 hypothetical protein HBH54_239390 [Parastagonospora nodorum]KAH3951013.1 hypothetical protein HBH53_068740 [Parastagonospora nodorum]KAH3962951.1 hypothetical protein HBH51_169410 [Parastagonospora nodorum]